MEVVETVFNTDKKAVERLRYYIERDAIICVPVSYTHLDVYKRQA